MFKIFKYLFITIIPITAGCVTEWPILSINKEGESFITWQSYRIDIYADGAVHYHGKADVNVIGDRYGKITPEQVRKIAIIYKKLYEKNQKFIAEFIKSYNERHNLDESHRIELERYKKDYIDRKKWDTSITFNDGKEISQYAPVGAYLNDFIAILNVMIDMDSWLCFPPNHPRRKYCPLLNHSDNYHLLMENTK